MTKKNKMNNEKGIAPPRGFSSFHMEADRSSRGMTLVLCGIIGISDFSDSCILLKSHSGRILVSGKRLHINVYEGGSAEIVGRVEGIEFKYGKN